MKNKLYKQFCKATDPDRKKQLHECFKNYRNITATLIGISKEKYYKSFFEENKKSSNISLNIDNETMTDNLTITNQFNNFSTLIAKHLVTKIQKMLKSFDSYFL